MSAIKIGRGYVYHERHGNIDNRFRYGTFFLAFDTRADISDFLRRGLWKIFSFKAQDYLDGKSLKLDKGIRTFLKDHCDFEAEEIWLQSMPRMFGYGFNPVSFWFCKRGGTLEAVLCEVNNTFGERHFYWLPTAAKTEWQRAQKVFHVSPFQPVEGHYEFRFDFRNDKSKVDINYFGADGKPRLTTWIDAKMKEIAAESPWSLLKSYGWMTPLVVLRIHFQALRLFVKKARFFKKPVPPQKEISS